MIWYIMTGLVSFIVGTFFGFDVGSTAPGPQVIGSRKVEAEFYAERTRRIDEFIAMGFEPAEAERKAVVAMRRDAEAAEKATA